MNTWIVNASPLILLGKINRLDLLEMLCPSFVIPYPVSLEILAGPDLDPAKKWIQSAQVCTRVVPIDTIPDEILAWDLGAGETAVLALASTRPGDICVLDDLAARNCAEVFQIPALGTVGILLKAKLAGLLPRLQPEIENLLAAGSLLASSVIQKALTLAGENS